MITSRKGINIISAKSDALKMLNKLNGDSVWAAHTQRQVACNDTFMSISQ